MPEEREKAPPESPKEREVWPCDLDVKDYSGQPRQASLSDEFRPQAGPEQPETPEAVQYYDHMSGELKHSQTHKARKFVEHGCVKYNGNGKFVCEPIPGYNSTTYLLDIDPSTRLFRCTCQCHKMQMRKIDLGETLELRPCSHILALIICFKERRFGHGQQA
jgi:hypothetical protein